MATRTIAPLDPKSQDRFWKKVAKKGPDECWLWTAGKGKSGYGQFGMQHTPYRSHRVAFTIAKGDPGALGVLHSCDTPACCNPSHLFLGTQKDNIRDAVSKGRNVKGEDNGQSRLTSKIVRIAKAAAGMGVTHSYLAEIWGVSRSAIGFAVAGKTWRSHGKQPSR